MKYEIRGTYKFVLATILVVALAMAGIQYSIYNIDQNTVNMGLNQGSMLVLQILIPLLIIALVAAFIAFIVYLIQSFRKELYDDRGYLTFTLPLNGKQILGAKFIIAVLWSVIFGLVLTGINALVFGMLFDGFTLEQIRISFSALRELLGGGVIFGTLMYFSISSLVSLLIVYFSITLSKVAIRNRHIGGLWILIYIGLQIIFNFIESRVIALFPLFVNIDGINTNHNLITTQFGLSIDIMSRSPALSLSALIYWVILGIGLFLLTSYLLDRKIEL